MTYSSVGNLEGMSFSNCKFHGARCVGNGGEIAILGDYNNAHADAVYPLTFDHCTADDTPDGLFYFASRPGAGPITITNNTINYTGTSGQSCPVMNIGGSHSYPVENLTFENNTINGAGLLMEVIWGSGLKNSTISNNYFAGKDPNNPSQSDSILYTGYTSGVQITGNTFENCKAPEQYVDAKDPMVTERPLFSKNTYTNVVYADGKGIFNLTSSEPVITPNFEEVRIYADTNNLVAVMSTDHYRDGQYVKITGGSQSLSVKFASGASSYYVAADRYLTGNETLWFRYSRSQGKWIETTAP
jgi:hypothetical protein